MSGKPGNVKEFDSCQGNVRDFCRAMRCISAANAVMRCLCVYHIHTEFFHHWQPHHSSFPVPNGMAIFLQEPSPLTGASNAGGVGRNRDSELICPLLTLQQARCCKHGRRWTTATISQVVAVILLVVYCGYSTAKRHAR